MLSRSAFSGVLYLDYDHCLHACDACLADGGLVESATTSRFFEFASVLEGALEPYASIAIVLSTSWVGAVGFAEALVRLPSAKLQDRVIGSTYPRVGHEVAAFERMSRGLQVRRHASVFNVKNWLALDDRRDGFEGVESRLVHCQRGVGLSDPRVVDVLKKRLASLDTVRS